MNTEIIVALIVFAGGGLTVFFNWQMNKRQNSGSVSTSDAASLWAESNSLRSEYKDRAERLEARLEEVNRQLQEVLTQLTSLQGKSDRMIRKIDELKKIIASLRAENSRLLSQRKKGHNELSTA